jgi:hypothetical protein
MGKIMAKKRRRRKKNGMNIPLAIVGGLGVGLSEPIEAAINGKIVGTGGAVDWLTWNYTGYSMTQKNFDITRAKGLAGLVLGALIHKYVGGAPLNVNRALASSGIPLIRV